MKLMFPAYLTVETNPAYSRPSHTVLMAGNLLVRGAANRREFKDTPNLRVLAVVNKQLAKRTTSIQSNGKSSEALWLCPITSLIVRSIRGQSSTCLIHDTCMNIYEWIIQPLLLKQVLHFHSYKWIWVKFVWLGLQPSNHRHVNHNTYCIQPLHNEK